METITIARLRPEAILPKRKHPQDAGLDLYAVETSLVEPHGFAIVPTGITLEIPAGVVGLIKPKGGSNHLLGAGVVDAGYQGEILVKVSNPTAMPLIFQPGDAVGQILFIPVFTPQVQELPLDQIHAQKSSRGGDGGILRQQEGEAS